MIDFSATKLGVVWSEGERVRLRHAKRSRWLDLIAAEEIRPGVLSLLDAAANADVPCGVASSSPSTWVERHLATHGLLDRFAVVRCADHVARPKPAPDLYLAACQALGVEPRHAVAFEDSRHGTAAAKAAGLYCVVCPNSITVTQDHGGADRVVVSLEEVDFDTLFAD